MKQMGRCQLSIKHPGFNLQVDFFIPGVGVLGLFGPSGSGKTSILRALAGLDRHDSCQVRLDHETFQSSTQFTAPEDRNFGFVFQDSQLFSHLSVAENLKYAQRRSVTVNPRYDRQFGHAEVVDFFDLKNLMSRMPQNLSGGEQQRVALARVLLRKPQLLILDEPLASLDQANKDKFIGYLRNISHQLQIPMIFVSHQINEVLALCDQLLIISGGQAHFQGSVADAMLEPRSPLSQVAQVSSVFEAQVISVAAEDGLMQVKTRGGLNFEVQGQAHIGQNMRLVVAANDISLALEKTVKTSVLNVFAGQVLRLTASGPYDQLVQIRAHNETLVARISNKSCRLMRLKVGLPLYAQLKTQAVHSFS